MKDLGITAVELMPVFEFDETMGKREVNGRMLLDYWGYNPVSFFHRIPVIRRIRSLTGKAMS